MTKQPWPVGSTFTVEAVALMFGKKTQTIYNLLCERASEFPAPTYAQLHRRGRGDRRLYRLLTEADLAIFRTIYLVRVK